MKSHSEGEGFKEDVNEKMPRDSWIKAFIEGNAIVPQSNTGVHVLPAEVIAREPPKNWKEFLDSQMTYEQFTHGTDRMNAAHRLAGVNVATPVGMEKLSNPDEARTLSPTRFFKLWESSKNTIAALFTYYVENCPQVHSAVVKDDPIITLNEFFKHEQDNVAAIAQLRAILKAAVTALRGPRVRPIAEALRQGYDGRVEQPDNIEELQEARKEEIVKILIEETIAACPDMDEKVRDVFLPEMVARQTRIAFSGAVKK